MHPEKYTYRYNLIKIYGSQFLYDVLNFIQRTAFVGSARLQRAPPQSCSPASLPCDVQINRSQFDSPILISFLFFLPFSLLFFLRPIMRRGLEVLGLPHMPRAPLRWCISRFGPLPASCLPPHPLSLPPSLRPLRSWRRGSKCSRGSSIPAAAAPKHERVAAQILAAGRAHAASVSCNDGSGM